MERVRKDIIDCCVLSAIERTRGGGKGIQRRGGIVLGKTRPRYLVSRAGEQCSWWKQVFQVQTQNSDQ